MTKKEYHDLLVRSAYDGTFPSVNETCCLYRGEGEQKCAVGVLVPNEAWKPEYESNNIRGRWTLHGLLRGPWKEFIPEGMTENHLSIVQEVHDVLAREWNPDMFVQRINSLLFFGDCHD